MDSRTESPRDYGSKGTSGIVGELIKDAIQCAAIDFFVRKGEAV